MKELVKNNLTLLLAFALPIILIAGVALSIYLPSLFVNTAYNFVYASCQSATGYYPYDCNNYLQQRYSVVDGKLVLNVVPPPSESDANRPPFYNASYETRIFLHDASANESRELTLEKAQALTMNSLLTSPDGASVSSGWDRGGGFFPFFDGGSSHSYYLTKGSAKRKLNLINSNDRYYYGENFKFLGWVIE